MSSVVSVAQSHDFVPASPMDSRSPCPALNALANHGYLPRDGTGVTFPVLLHAVRHVYNLSMPLAFLLTFVGFITSGTISQSPCAKSTGTSPLFYVLLSILGFKYPNWTLDLASLSARGSTKITHDASLVHPDVIPSRAPDPVLLSQLLQYGNHSHGSEIKGLTLLDLAHIHSTREASLKQPLSSVHEQVALGEYALAWCVMRDHSPQRDIKEDELENSIPISRLEQWFGQERLPDGWWDRGARPPHQVGLLEARRWAGEVEKDMT